MRQRTVSAASTILSAIGILAVVVGIVLIVLDYTGRGDTSGLDYKDVGILVVGIVLTGIGGSLAIRKGSVAPPS